MLIVKVAAVPGWHRRATSLFVIKTDQVWQIARRQSKSPTRNDYDISDGELVFK